MIEHPDPDPKLGSGKKVTDPVHLVSTSHEASPSQFGHHYETQQWSAVFGVVYTTPDPPPVSSAKTLHLNSQFNLKSDDSMHRDVRVPVSLVPLPSGALSNQEFCNTPGVYHQLSGGFKIKHDRLSGVMTISSYVSP
jgi:hypothetical protein